MSEVKDEINEMLSALEGVTPPKVETPPEEKKEVVNDSSNSKTDSTAVAGADKHISSELAGKETGEARTETLGTDEHLVEQSAPVVPVSDSSVPRGTDIDEKDKIIADLQAKLAASLVAKEPVKEPVKPEPVKLEDQDFLEGLDLDDLTRDPKEFNKLLNKVYMKASNDVLTGVRSEIPEQIKSTITILNSLKEASEKFYKENEDLQGFKKVVAVVFEELASESPDKTYNELISNVGPEVRKRLGITKKETPKTVLKPVPPKLPAKGSSSGRVSDETKLEPLQAELEEMNKALTGR
jgi:hypothetical protein